MKPHVLATTFCVAALLGDASANAAAEPNEVEALARAAGVDLPAFPQGEELESLVKAASQYPLGGPDNPVRVASIRASYEYLSRLSFLDGQRPSIARAGTGPKLPFGRIVDVYDVGCDGRVQQVYIDAYHASHFEKKAPEGLKLR